jgi:hypothetical protein
VLGRGSRPSDRLARSSARRGLPRWARSAGRLAGRIFYTATRHSGALQGLGTQAFDEEGTVDTNSVRLPPPNDTPPNYSPSGCPSAGWRAHLHSAPKLRWRWGTDLRLRPRSTTFVWTRALQRVSVKASAVAMSGHAMSVSTWARDASLAAARPRRALLWLPAPAQGPENLAHRGIGAIPVTAHQRVPRSASRGAGRGAGCSSDRRAVNLVDIVDIEPHST